MLIKMILSPLLQRMLICKIDVKHEKQVSLKFERIDHCTA